MPFLATISATQINDCNSCPLLTNKENVTKKEKDKTPRQVALSTRLDRETYIDAYALLEVTGKSMAVFAHDAISEYIKKIKDPKSKPSDALRIDQFAWELKNKRKEV